MSLVARLRERADELRMQGNKATAPLLEEAADALELELSLTPHEIAVLISLGGVAIGIMVLALVAVINLAM